MFEAIHAGKPDRQLLSYQYLQMLPQLAQGDANKVFVIPSEFADAFGGIAKAFADSSIGERLARAGETARALASGRRGRMFDSLAEKLQATLADVRGRGTLTEDDVNAAMREIRLALLEADVNFKVVKTFTNAVKERALGADVIGQLNPGQQVVKIVSDELTELMGGAARDLSFSPRPPTVVLMAGLQGSGKTTATAKLARYLREEHGSSVAVAACDVYRPAAVDQLIKVGAQAGADVYEQGTDRDPVKIAGVGPRPGACRRARTC